MRIKKLFNVKNMTCSACSAKIEDVLEKNNISAKVNLLSEKLIVEYDSDILSENDIKNIVSSIGYELYETTIENDISDNKMNTNIALIGILTAIVVFLAMGHMIGINIKLNRLNATIQIILTTVIIFLARLILKDGINKIRKIAFNMNSLIAIGVISSYLYSSYNFFVSNLHNLYFEGVCVILFTVLLGKKIESNLKKKTNDVIEGLSKLIPSTCYILVNDSIVKILTSDLKVGDILVLKEGQISVADGNIISGYASVDESSITGESRYIYKSVNDEIIGSTLITSGNINVKVTRIGKDTVFSKILNIVEFAGEIKPPITKYIDKISLYFVPFIIIIAIITGISWYIITKDISVAINNFVVVLVIACPCSIGLATPTSIVVAAGVLAKNNILIKDGVALEKSYKITDIIMDKTGTITSGKPKIMDVIIDEKYNKEQILNDIYNIEKYIEHPLSKAIVTYINEEIKLEEKEFKVRNFQGMGVMSDKYLIGNEMLMTKKSVDIKGLNDEYLRFSKEGKTVIFISYDNNLAGLITLIDDIKDTSYSFINKTRKNKINFSILTGDNENTARYIANKLNIKNVISQVLPYEKSRYVEAKLSKDKVVAMVGDGINDAPALLVSDIGIAVGSGVDIALKTCDVILMKNDLNDIDKLIKMSRYTMLNIKENLFWGFIYNLFGVIIATGVTSIRITPMMASIFMMLSSISVLTNAIRLKYKKI